MNSISSSLILIDQMFDFSISEKTEIYALTDRREYFILLAEKEPPQSATLCRMQMLLSLVEQFKLAGITLARSALKLVANLCVDIDRIDKSLYDCICRDVEPSEELIDFIIKEIKEIDRAYAASWCATSTTKPNDNWKSYISITTYFED